MDNNSESATEEDKVASPIEDFLAQGEKKPEDASSEGVRDALMGEQPSVLGRKMRPITLATLALLQKSGNDLVAGKPLEECNDMLMDACKLLLIQSIPLREAAQLIKDPEEFEMRAYEIAETVEPQYGEGFIDAMLSMVKTEVEGRVEPVSTEGPAAPLSFASLGEK